MRLPDDNKRRQILLKAADHFANHAYHKVRLDDIAAAAGVGKGTLYVYFQSKEEIYISITYEAVNLLIGRLKNQLLAEHASSIERMQTILKEMVHFAFQYPHFFEVLKSASAQKDVHLWRMQCDMLFELIEEILRQGVSCGELTDPNPHLTARLIPGLVRSAMLFARDSINPDLLESHLVWLLCTALKQKSGLVQPASL